MNKEEFLKAIMELPKVETDTPISAYGSINVDDLISAVDRLNKVPTYDELLRENQQLKDKWNKLKEWVNKSYDYYINNADYIGGRLCFTDMKNNMQELEQGGEIND